MGRGEEAGSFLYKISIQDNVLCTLCGPLALRGAEARAANILAIGAGSFLNSIRTVRQEKGSFLYKISISSVGLIYHSRPMDGQTARAHSSSLSERVSDTTPHVPYHPRLTRPAWREPLEPRRVQPMRLNALPPTPMPSSMFPVCAYTKRLRGMQPDALENEHAPPHMHKGHSP